MDSLIQAQSNHHCFSVLMLALANLNSCSGKHLLCCYKPEWTSQTSGGKFITINFFLHWRTGNMLSQKEIMCLDWSSLSTIITIVYFSKQNFPNLSSTASVGVAFFSLFFFLIDPQYIFLGTMVKNPPANAEYARNVCSVPRLGKILWSRK